MIEWVVIISMHMGGSLDTYSAEVIDGFQSEQTCSKAGEAIASKFETQFLNHLAAAGVDMNDRDQHPIVFYACAEISK